MVINKIPPQKLKGTPLYILATAGMRLIHPDQQEAILQDCRIDIAKKYPNLYFPPSHIQIISGKMEGIYAWIAINYILGKFNDVSKDETVGIIDMGGASLQIAFQIPSEYKPESLQQYVNSSMEYGKALKILNESMYDVKLSENNDFNYKIYVKTFLGFGANEIIDQYHRNLYSKHSFVFSKYHGDELKPADDKKPTLLLEDRKILLSKIIVDPCFPNGYTYNLSASSLGIDDDDIPAALLSPDGADTAVHLAQIRGTGNFDKCYSEQLSPFLRLNGTGCYLDPCTLEGAHFPRINLTKLYGFSEFWYSAHDVLGIGGPYDAFSFKSHASNFCAKPWDASILTNGQYPNADNHRLINQCVKSAWLYAVLHEGFGFPRNDTNFFESVQLVEGKEAHWSLGAILHSLVNDKNFTDPRYTETQDLNMEDFVEKKTDLAVSALLPVFPVQHFRTDKKMDANTFVSKTYDDLTTYYGQYSKLKEKYSRIVSWTTFFLISLFLALVYYFCGGGALFGLRPFGTSRFYQFKKQYYNGINLMGGGDKGSNNNFNSHTSPPASSTSLPYNRNRFNYYSGSRVNNGNSRRFVSTLLSKLLSPILILKFHLLPKSKNAAGTTYKDKNMTSKYPYHQDYKNYLKIDDNDRYE